MPLFGNPQYQTTSVSAFQVNNKYTGMTYKTHRRMRMQNHIEWSNPLKAMLFVAAESQRDDLLGRVTSLVLSIYIFAQGLLFLRLAMCSDSWLCYLVMRTCKQYVAIS